MKKITLLLGFLCLGLATGNLSAQEFSANAKAEIAKNNFLPAIEELTSFLQSSPNDEILLTYRANFYAKAGQNEKAIADATKLMTINPKSTNGLITLGTAKIGLGRTQEGIDNLTQALAIQPNLKPALIFRSKAYFAVNQPEKSLADLNMVLKEDPKSMEAYVYRAQLYSGMKQFDAAKADYQFILKNAVAGDRYYVAATDKMKELQQSEMETKAANTRKAEDDAYVTKITDQMKTINKDLEETTKRISDLSQKYQKDIEGYIVRINAIPKSDHEQRTELFNEVHPKIQMQVDAYEKEISKMKGKELYAGIVQQLQKNIEALAVVLDRTSPYAARRQQYVAEVNATNDEITAHFKKMLEFQKSSNEAEFERNKILAIGKTKNLLLSINESKEDLLKLDPTEFREKDELKINTTLAEYNKTLATINSINY